MPGQRQHVLVVDDEVNTRKLVALNLKARGYRVSEAASVDDAFAIASRGKLDMSLIDIMLNEQADGLELSRRIRGISPKLPIIIMTAFVADKFKLASIESGATLFLPKPFSVEQLLSAVRSVSSHRDLQSLQRSK